MPHPAVKLLTQDLLQTTAEQAQSSPRLRKNYNFHTLPERVQRFINVMQPGTYVRPHCHHRPTHVNGFEFFLVIQGSLGMVVMDEQGTVLEAHWVSDRGPVRAIELAEGTYHTLVVLEPNTAILEIKEGPYDPQTDKHFLPQFPAEGTPEAQSLVKTWEAYFAHL
ncbi:MAG: WbuC family cupin fold metalloprotein, partial [Synechococcales bacterium]|nr:WbuC family cupin fold metalloprotein [Synechococcales bacterium]